MIQYNPHLVGALMADRDRQISKKALLREIRRAKQDQMAATAALPKAIADEVKLRPKVVGATL